MRKFRIDAKPINLLLAMKLYWEGGSLRQVANIFKIDHANLLMRFRRFNIPLKSKRETKRRFSYRDIAEFILDRALKSGEVVHHLDGNRSNNTHSNLLICTKDYHSWLHAKLCYGLIGQNYVGNSLPKKQI